MVRVVVVDDDSLVRTGLKYILAAEPGISVAAITCTGNAIATVQEHKPDVVLYASRAPGKSDLDVLRAIAGVELPPPVCMLSHFDASDRLARALEFGVGGFLHKDTDLDQLGAMVRFLAVGGLALSGRAGRTVRSAFNNRRVTHGGQAIPPQSLTTREREILTLIAEGLTNQEIAANTYLGIGTVKDYVSSLFSKLGVSNRVQAALTAERAGLLSSPSSEEEVLRIPDVIGAL